MCGFIGTVNFFKPPKNENLFFDWALKDLHRRGPDQQNIWVDNDGLIKFGFARLAIRDLTEAGKQPMSSASGRLVLMYNGETYNTDHLLNWAGVQKATLKGHSDSEVILTCMESRGIMETIQQMDGIFAMAVLNLEKRQLFLVRDHAGVKPLYLGFNNNGIVFSSHYHHVTNHPYFCDEIINQDALINYFRYGFIQAGEGLFYNTFFLPHSHAVVVDISNRSWNYERYEPITHLHAEALDKVYEHVVTSQLVSDVPVGTFLSGGVDSTLTTAIASKIIPSIRAYTIGVKNGRLDEAPEAVRFASYLNVEQTIKYIEEEDILNVIKQYEQSLAEPLGDYSSLVTLKVCEAAKKDLTVVLSGDGGDELFYGYPRFVTAALYYPYLAQPLVRRFCMILLARLNGKKIPFRLLKFSNFLDYYLSVQGQTGNSEWLSRLICKPVKFKVPFFVKNYNQPQNFEEALEMARQIECDIHLQRVLLKVDRASMFHSLEVRTPMLSTEFIKKAFLYNFKQCVRDFQGKIPLRELLIEHLPSGVPQSGSKRGFEPPMREWLQTELKEEVQRVLNQIPSPLLPIISASGVKQLWEEHQKNLADHSWPLWSLYSLFKWLNKSKSITL